MSFKRAPYPHEFRRQLVELVRSGRTPEELAREFEPSAQSIRNWVAAADSGQGRRSEEAKRPGGLRNRCGQGGREAEAATPVRAGSCAGSGAPPPPILHGRDERRYDDCRARKHQRRHLEAE